MVVYDGIGMGEGGGGEGEEKIRRKKLSQK